MSRPRTAPRTRWTSITALDIVGDDLQVVQASLRGGQARLVRHAAVPLNLPAEANLDDPAPWGQAVAAALERAGVNPGSVVMAVPRSQVMLRALDLPPADRADEVAAMVHLRLSRDLPFPLDEALVDFRVLSAQPEPPAAASTPGPTRPPASKPSTRVLTAVVRRRTVDHYQALAKAAGLKLGALGLRSSASAHAVLSCRPEIASGCVAVVSLQPPEVVFDVIVDGALVFSRVDQALATREPQAAEVEPTQALAQDAVLMEVLRNLHSFEGIDGHRPVARFVVTGSTGSEAKLAAALARQFKVPSEVLGPAPTWTGTPFTPESLSPALPAIGLALGALGEGEVPLDFLNPKRPPVRRDDRRTKWLALAAAGLAVLLAAGGLRARWIGQRERLRAELQEQLTLASKNLGAYRLVRNQARTLKEWSAGSRSWLDHLTVLSALLPHSRELYVTALSASPRNTLNLAVKVRSGETVDQLTTTLRAAGYDLKAPAIMPASDRFGFRFQANLELVVPATVTNDLETLTVETRTPAPSPPPPPAAPPRTEPPPANTAATSPPATNTTPDAPPPALDNPPRGSSSEEPQNRGPRNRRRRPEGGNRE